MFGQSPENSGHHKPRSGGGVISMIMKLPHETKVGHTKLCVGLKGLCSSGGRYDGAWMGYKTALVIR